MMLLQTNNDAQAALDVLSNPMTNSALQQHLAGRSARHRPSEAAVVSHYHPQFCSKASSYCSLHTWNGTFCLLSHLLAVLV